MFSYYILPTGYLIVLFAFSLLKPIRFVVTMYEFQGLMIKSVVLGIFGLFSFFLLAGCLSKHSDYHNIKSSL